MTGIVVIGAGRWGTHLIRNVLEHPDAKLVAVVDRDPDRLAAIADRFSLDGRVVLTTGWTSARQLPAGAVIVATPASEHEATIADALERGYHVLAEKPLTLTAETATTLCELAQKHQRILNVDHTYLFHPCVERGAEVVKAGRLGDLRYGYAARTHLGPVRRDVDALWDLAIHDIAIFNTWLGEFPTQVRATGQIWLHAEAESAPRDLFPDGLADLAWAHLTYPSGFQAQIHLCWCNPHKQRRLAVVGSEGTLVFDELDEMPLSLYEGRLDRAEDGYWNPTSVNRAAIDVAPGEPLRRVCDRFLESIQSGQPCDRSSGWVGAKLVKVLRGLSESSRQGGTTVNLD
jgi:predicted dehydrogenase